MKTYIIWSCWFYFQITHASLSLQNYSQFIFYPVSDLWLGLPWPTCRILHLPYWPSWSSHQPASVASQGVYGWHPFRPACWRADFETVSKSVQGALNLTCRQHILNNTGSSMDLWRTLIPTLHLDTEILLQFFKCDHTDNLLSTKWIIHVSTVYRQGCHAEEFIQMLCTSANRWYHLLFPYPPKISPSCTRPLKISDIMTVADQLLYYSPLNNTFSICAKSFSITETKFVRCLWVSNFFSIPKSFLKYWRN